MTADRLEDRTCDTLPGTVDLAVGEPQHGATGLPADASSRRRSALGLALLVTVVVAVHSPMLSIHPWGDDFENLRLAFSIHQSPWRALQPNYLFFRPVMLLMVLPLAPTLHFPVSPTRFNALPLVGFWIAVVGLAEYLVSDRRAWQRVAAGLAAGVVALQSVLLRLEILDYRWYGELHRQLVLYVEEIEDLLPESGVAVVFNAGAFDGPGAFQRSVRGMTKYIYPKPGGMWDLVFFPSLVEFAGRPFEVRVEPVSPDRISPRTIASAVVLVFQDQGFAPCEECRDEVLRLVSAGEPLPERIGVYSLTSVNQRLVAVSGAPPAKDP